jgi:hypothetical protein
MSKSIGHQATARLSKQVEADALSDLRKAIERCISGISERGAAALARKIANVAHQCAASATPTLTQATAKKQATEIHDACVRLQQALTSEVASQLPTIACIANKIGSALGDDGLTRLASSLEELRNDARIALGALGGDASLPQLSYPSRGDKPDAARRIASAVLFELWARRAVITAGSDTSPAVQCVHAAFVLTQQHAKVSARHHVQRWIKSGRQHE